MNEALLSLLERVLGKSKPTSKGNYSFFCCFCNHSTSPKLEIQLTTNELGQNKWRCWHCNKRGFKASQLLKEMKADSKYLDEAKLLTKDGGSSVVYERIDVMLPKEFISLVDIDEITDRHTKITAKHALKYIKQRGLTEMDVIKYNIGFAASGPYSNRIIIPSYDSTTKLNYFVARSFDAEERQKYKNPPVELKSIIGFELFINWKLPIIIVEGIFDALCIKRNVVPLFGKVIPDHLLLTIIKSGCTKVYIALDADAKKDAIASCEKLLKHNIETYFVEIVDKDISEIGAQKTLTILEETYPLDFGKLLELKLNMI